MPARPEVFVILQVVKAFVLVELGFEIREIREHASHFSARRRPVLAAGKPHAHMHGVSVSLNWEILRVDVQPAESGSETRLKRLGRTLGALGCDLKSLASWHAISP